MDAPHRPVSIGSENRMTTYTRDPFSMVSWGNPEPATIFDGPKTSCIAKGAFSFLAGFPMGMFFAFLMPPNEATNPTHLGENAKLREKVWAGWKLSARHGWQNGKLFARMGLLWSTSECAVEVIRARNDPINGVIGGCMTGILLGTGGGVTGMGLGCAGFATMGFVFEKLMHAAMSGGNHQPH